MTALGHLRNQAIFHFHCYPTGTWMNAWNLYGFQVLMCISLVCGSCWLGSGYYSDSKDTYLWNCFAGCLCLSCWSWFSLSWAWLLLSWCAVSLVFLQGLSMVWGSSVVVVSLWVVEAVVWRLSSDCCCCACLRLSIFVAGDCQNDVDEAYDCQSDLCSFGLS